MVRFKIDLDRDDELAVGHSGALVTNKGATGPIEALLPVGDTGEPVEYLIAVVEPYPLTLRCPTGGEFVVNGSPTSLTSSAPGALLLVVNSSVRRWSTMASGSWT